MRQPGDQDRGDSGQERRIPLAWPADPTTTLSPLRHGRWDPTVRIEAGPDGGSVWRATRASSGPATVVYRRDGADLLARAWGPGAMEELDRAARVLGADDDASGLPGAFPALAQPLMAEAHRRFGPGWRAPRTGRVLEALVPAILEQRVTGPEASRAWATLVRQFGEPAPGPAALWLAPDAAGWSGVPSWAWHRAGVDPGRAATIVAAARRADALERLSDRPPGEAAAALRSVPGVGVWTAAEVAARAWGDPDTVSFGDYHLAGYVVWALTGRPGGTDEELAELLEAWAGQRARAVRMVELHCPKPPRRGPRAAVTDHRRW